MSNATRRIRGELAQRVLVSLGIRKDGELDGLSDAERVAEAEEVLCRRIQCMLGQLHDVGIPKAKTAREIDVDAGALSDLADGGTSRLGFETLWEAYTQLAAFLGRASERLRPALAASRSTEAELLGFGGHPDLAKMKGSDALEILGHNILVTLGDDQDTLRPFGPHVKGASAVYSRSRYWLLTALICPDTPEEMTRIARDEIWHVEQWLGKQDKKLKKRDTPRSAF